MVKNKRIKMLTTNMLRAPVKRHYSKNSQITDSYYWSHNRYFLLTLLILRYFFAKNNFET